MTRISYPLPPSARLLAGAALLVSLTGCVSDDSNRRTGYRDRPIITGQATVMFEDDYDYYPSYEVYYSRNRREYVYRDGNSWVRRPEPRGISVSALLALPSVRVDFRDSPENHHANVVRSYPRNWQRSSSSVQVQATVGYEDDYDYYPGYEVYYSRNRREYVYRDGNSWVRRPEPRGVSLNVLLAAPSVRVDFRDSPERHHANVVRSYPRNWKRQDDKGDHRNNKQNERKDKRDRKDDDKDDRKDDRR